MLTIMRQVKRRLWFLKKKEKKYIYFFRVLQIKFFLYKPELFCWSFSNTFFRIVEMLITLIYYQVFLFKEGYLSSLLFKGRSFDVILKDFGDAWVITNKATPSCLLAGLNTTLVFALDNISWNWIEFSPSLLCIWFILCYIDSRC